MSAVDNPAVAIAVAVVATVIVVGFLALTRWYTRRHRHMHDSRFIDPMWARFDAAMSKQPKEPTS